MNRTLAFSLGLLVASVIGVSWALQHHAGGDPVDALAAVPAWVGEAVRPDPVLVVVLDRPQGLASVRAVIPTDRIVAETVGAFAVRERRLVASSFDAVGPVLVAAGWRDAPLEIVALRARAPIQRLEVDPVDRVSELMNKPTLNLLEARALLQVL